MITLNKEFLQDRVKKFQAELKEMSNHFGRIKQHNEREKARLMEMAGLTQKFQQMDEELENWKVENQKLADNISGRIFELKELIENIEKFEQLEQDLPSEEESQEDKN